MKPIKAYAGYSKNQDVRMSSSSGAIFSSLAGDVLKQDGIVYGVKMAEDCFSAEFTRATDSSEIAGIRGSKYLQAKVGNTYKQVKEDLEADRLVLFSGTGCQVNGLKGFLGKEYDHLLCVDVICHGVPSPALWRKYAQHMEQQHGGKLTSIHFRCKDVSWKDFGMKEAVETPGDVSKKRLFIPKEKDPFMRMFLRDYCLRPACYACCAKRKPMADITIGDFWGIDAVAPEMNDGKGTSLILVRTEKGLRALEAISAQLKLKTVSYEDAVRGNPAEYQSCSRPPQRNTFFADMRTMDFQPLAEEYAKEQKISLMGQAKRVVKRAIRIIRQILPIPRGG